MKQETEKDNTLEKKLSYEELRLPNYVNNRPAFANLTVTDLTLSAVLGGLNILLVGDSGKGKTQLARDIYNHIFGGDQARGGHGIMVRGYRLIDSTLYDEVFTELNIDKARRELTDSIQAAVSIGDELNRAPVVRQNDFLELGDGVLNYKGKSIPLGIDGYHVVIATANIGNGEFQGTFDTDKALYNRLHVAIDFDHPQFAPTDEDEILLDTAKAANPRIKEATHLDLLAKILAANKEITSMSQNIGLDAQTVINYLRFGLKNCMQNKGEKEKNWPIPCQECPDNKAGDALCAHIRAPVRRTMEATIRYAAAMQFLSQLKNPEVQIDPVDLIFKSFEFTGAYQLLLNPGILKQEYHEQNPKMMAHVVEKLKEDYLSNISFIYYNLDELEKKQPMTTEFFTRDNSVDAYRKLSAEAKKKVKANERIKPYNDNRPIGMSWMKTFLEANNGKMAEEKKEE